MRDCWAAPTLAILAAACAAPGAEGRSSAILNGEAEDAYGSTVYLFNTAGVACTGTLVSARVVLTAKHCIASVPEDGWLAAVGPQGEVAQVAVEQITTTDGVQTENVDIALMVLAEAPGPEPVALGRDFGLYQPGQVLTLVGYGDTEGGTNGRKRRTTGQLNTIGPDVTLGVLDNEFLVTGDQTGAGRGDSGGPLFDEHDVQIGIMVRATVDQGCETSPDPCVTVGLRVDRFLDLIDETIAAVEVGDAIEDPTPVDTGNLGEPCDDDDTCSSALCEQDLCTARCDLLQGDGCPDGFYCDARGACGEGRCAPGEAGSGRLGARCSEDLECATRLCAETAEGEGRCAVACDPEADRPCSSGAACSPTRDGCGACLDEADLGAACSAPDDCASGLCEDGVCSAPCDEEATCPGGFVCEAELCRPSGGRLGEPCATRGDCSTGLCGRAGDTATGLCTMSCTDDEVCGDGFRCARSTQQTGACWPLEPVSGADPGTGLVGQTCSAGPVEPPPATASWLLLGAIGALLVRRRAKGLKPPGPPFV